METTISLAQVLSMVVGVFLPIVVGLVTTHVTHSGIKGTVLALLSAVAGFLSEWVAALQAGEAFAIDQALLAWLGTFVVAVATHFGLWKPTRVSEKAQRVLVTDRATRNQQEAGQVSLPSILWALLIVLIVVAIISVVL